jgi:signal transduction histidine kinase
MNKRSIIHTFIIVRNWLANTIARKLLLAFMLVFLITYLATALVVLSAVRSAVTRSELVTVAQLAQFRLNNLNVRLEQLSIDLHAWSRLDVMNDLASGDIDKRVERALSGMKSDYSLKGELYAFDASGRLLAGTQTQHGNLPSVWKAGDKLNFVDKHHNPFGDDEIIALSMPVISSFSSSFRLGTLVLAYPWREIEHMLDENAVLLHRSANKPMLLGSTLQQNIPNRLLADLATRDGWIKIGGVEYLVNHAEKRTGLITNWQVVALRSPDFLSHILNSVALQLALLCLILAVPLTLAIRWLARRLTGPLRDLTEFVVGITETGDLSQRLLPDTQDEIGTLAAAFNHMVVRLESASQERERFVHKLEVFAEELEDKVQERTGELTTANDELTNALKNLKSAQSQLIHQEKMASLGQLVAGVAHELNNPISFIYANFPHIEEYANTLIELLDKFHDLPLTAAARLQMEAQLVDADLDFLREDLPRIIHSGQSGVSRVKEIIASLRSFSRLDEAVLKAVQLEDGLDDTLALLHHHYKNRLEIIKDYQLNRAVLCKPGQLNQVFMNIIYNAIQATRDGGIIRIATRQEYDWAIVAISDNGCGIPQEILGHIFDPFFTTKQVGEGTGLGLSISYGIIKSHGGRIEVSSELARGTTFTIYLPLSRQNADDKA